jgi:hypothetical protein
LPSPRLKLRDLALQLQQGFAPGEMGFQGQVAQQQSRTADVLVGSKADISARPRHVRFTSAGSTDRRNTF